MDNSPKIPRWLLNPGNGFARPVDCELLDAAMRIECERRDAERARRLTKAEAKRRRQRYRALRPVKNTQGRGGPLPSPVDRILRKNEVLRLTGLSYNSIYRMMKEGTFPQSRKLFPETGSRMVGWSGREVVGWICAKLNADFDRKALRASR